MIKRLIFDLDNTLIDWKEEYWNSVNKALDELNIKYSKNDIEKIRKSIDIYEDGRNSTYNKQLMLETINSNLENFKLPEEFMQLWIKNLSICIPEEIDTKITSTLEYLYKKYELVILTNWIAESQMNRLKNTKLDKYFMEVYAAEDIIPMKPDIMAFKIAMGDYKEDECVMIGDSIKTDIMGAVNANIKAIYLRKNYEKYDKNLEKTEKIIVINKLEELKRIL